MYTTKILGGPHAVRRKERQDDRDHWDQHVQEKLLSAERPSVQDSPQAPGVVETIHRSPRDQEMSSHLLQKSMEELDPTPSPASSTIPLPGSPAHLLVMATAKPHAC